MGFVVDPARENGYPSLTELPDAPAVVRRKPYYIYLMRIFDASINNCYPCIPAIENIPESSLDFYYGNTHGNTAFFGNTTATRFIFTPSSN